MLTYLFRRAPGPLGVRVAVALLLAAGLVAALFTWGFPAVHGLIEPASNTVESGTA